jgi:hypothetical protein
MELIIVIVSSILIPATLLVTLLYIKRMHQRKLAAERLQKDNLIETLEEIVEVRGTIIEDLKSNTMKNVFTLLIALSFAPAFAQMPLSSETHKFTYTEVIDTPGAKDDIYLRARKWFLNTYNSAQDVVAFDDREAGQISGSGSFDISLLMGLQRTVKYTVTIDVKDNKFRYTFTSFYIHWHNTTNDVHAFEEAPMSRDKLYSKTDEHMRALIADLKKQMAERTASAQW